MNIETKFNVGDTVFYLKKIWLKKKCPECGQCITPNAFNMGIIKVKITEISYIRKRIMYAFDNGDVFENEIFATFEDAEAKQKELENENQN